MTRKEILEIFDYDEERDVLIWKKHSLKKRIGRVVQGSLKSGQIGLNKTTCRVKALIYIIKHGDTFEFSYDQLSSILKVNDKNELIWIDHKHSRFIGKIAGNKTGWVGIYGKKCRAVDIITLLENKRLITKKEKILNKYNSSKNVSTSKGNLKGVSKRNNRYEGRINVKGNIIYLGSFDTQQEAHEAYLTALKKRVK